MAGNLQKLYNRRGNNPIARGFRILGEEFRMAIAAITGQGLRWIGTLVVLLWACVITEDATVKHARRTTAHILVELRQLRGGTKPVPVSQPPVPHAHFRPALG